MGLQEKLTRLRKGFESQAPKEVVDVMHRATDDLEKSGILDITVKVGDQAPDFSLKTADYTVRPDPEETVAALQKMVG